MNVNQVVRTITIRSKTEGMSQSTSELNKLSAAQQGVADSAGRMATVTDMASKKQLSIADAYRRQTLALDETARMQDKMARATLVADRALQQGSITHAEHAKRVSLINQQYGQLSRTQQSAAIITSDFQSRIAAATGATGTYGAALAALGPIGAAVTVTIGAAILTFNAMSDAAHRLAEKAQELRRFSEVTGLTTTQVQALRSEASKFGVTSDEAQTAIQNFTARFDDLRRGQGELLTQIRRVNPALAEQMQTTTNAGDALTLFAQGLSKVDDVFQRNALVKAATGRGGIGAAQFLASLNVDKLTESYQAAGKGLDENLIKKLAQLEIDVQKASKVAGTSIAAIFAEPVLRAELQFLENFNAFVLAAKNFSMSDDLKIVMKVLAQGALSAVNPIFGIIGSAAGIIGGPGTESKAAAENFSGRFQPSLDSPLKPFTPSQGKTLEAQVADMRKLIEVLGPAATETEKLALKQKELELSARDAGVSTKDLARAQAALNQEFKLNQLRETVSALGAAATAAEQLALRTAELQQKVAQGAISQQTMNRALADFKAEQQITDLRNNIQALGNAATAAEQYKLRVMELQQQLARGQISQETFNRAMFEANPLVQDVKSSIGELGKSLVQSMLAGKSFTESLSSGLKNLSARLADKAIEQLLSGDFEKAAISAVSAIATALGSSMFDSGNKFKDFIEGADRAQQLKLRAISTEEDSLAKRLHQFDEQANVERVEEARKGNQARKELEEALAAERLRVIDDFNKEVLEKERAAEEQRIAIHEAFFQRFSSAQDRLLAASVNVNTLEGQLALFDRQSQREREDEIRAGGQALEELYRAQAAERLKIERDFNDKQLDETKRAAQEKLDIETRAARGIVDYLNSLQVGPDSSLSPAQRLNAAQSTYNSILALAQQGNADALGRITSDFENLRKAAQAFYGSSAGYQNILSAGITQLTNLPGVASSTNDVVAAVRDVVTAVNSTTAAANQTKAAVDADKVATVDKLSEAIGNLATVINRLDQTLDKLSNNNSLLDSIENFSNRTINAFNGLGTLTAQFARSNHDENNIIMTKLGNIPNNAPAQGGGGQSIWEWFGFQRGGIIGAYAPGGIVGNGISNVDSVLARYAGGGYIGLAGGEGILNQRATASIGADAVNFMNRTHTLPSANDNGSVEAKLDKLIDVLANVGAALVNAEHASGNEVAGKVVQALAGYTQEMKSQARQDSMNPKNSKAA